MKLTELKQLIKEYENINKEIRTIKEKGGNYVIKKTNEISPFTTEYTELIITYLLKKKEELEKIIKQVNSIEIEKVVE